MKLPSPLNEFVEITLAEWQTKNVALSPETQAALKTVFCASEFISENCLRHPEWLIDLDKSGDLLRVYDENVYLEKLLQKTFIDDADLMRQLRHFRQQEMIRIAWRDIANWAGLKQTLKELSWLADACIQTALSFLYAQACEKRGTPVLSDGTPQQIVVLGMGKLGAYELNYSSDIDLIFAYAEDGVLNDRKSTSYGEFFTRLCQNLVRVLDEITVDGFVFRTDIRLRPYGDSGAVIMTFDGMEHYYLTQAREWERYAMIKARQVAGDFETGKQLMKMLNAFVYRRYLDYGAFEELRSLKAQITQELRRKDRAENVKLGLGGIREIEFIGQAFQLIRGGSEKRLQVRPILDVLAVLHELNLLTPEDATQLRESYLYLRRVENRIQQYQDKQTHDLPTNEKAKQSLFTALGYSDWESFKQDLDAVRANVHGVFDLVFALSKQEQIQQLSQQIWSGNAENEELLENLKNYGFQELETTLTHLEQFKNSVAVRRLSNKGLNVLNRLMPQVIAELKNVDNPDETLKRVLALFEAVAGRNVYLALLAENPHALTQLLKLTSASVWISAYLARYPILFDELLDTRSLYEPLKKADLIAQLKKWIADIELQDVETFMIRLRQFKQLNVLRVAAADIMGAIPLMVVSDYLTYIAETLTECVLQRAWQMLGEKYGYPNHATAEKVEGFAIIGFGKFGGIELGYGSDLDLVFISDESATSSNAPFYLRLAQKIRSILETKLLSGDLYEVDMRLRPNGDSGTLVTNIEMYDDYLKNQAWTWEHQALVRSRFIAGDEKLKTRYKTMRHTILSLKRDEAHLKKDVVEMREKMRESLATKNTDKFDLKHSQGGIVDIEFMVQFGVLGQAQYHPNLTTYTDNVRLLEGLETCHFFNQTDITQLKNAYCIYRNLGHKQVLQGNKNLVELSEIEQLKTQVEHIWQKIML